VITDHFSSHTSVSTTDWLADHPRIGQVFIPKRACWLNLQEGWWRIFRKTALAGQSFADPDEIIHARPWVWGRPPPAPRHHRHVLTYRL
jgi:hypothetical protein